MPIIGSTRAKRPGFVESVKHGLAVPIISDEVLFDLVLGGNDEFIRQYAGYIEYPLEDQGNLPKMAKYRKLAMQDQERSEGRDFTDNDLRADYLNYVKNVVYFRAQAEGVDDDLLAEAEEQIDLMTVTEFANLLGYPDFEGKEDNPLLVLANLPFRTILTTSPFMFIEDALRRAGKEPLTAVCRWRKDLSDLIDENIDDHYRPDAHHPLVYHLYGLDTYSSSLVLTEDDYLEFLVNVSQGRGDDSRDNVHALVRRALSSDLLVLGFDLNSWGFRALHAGLIKSDETHKEKQGLCILQFAPSNAEKQYLHDYVKREARFDVFWGTFHSYSQELLKL